MRARGPPVTVSVTVAVRLPDWARTVAVPGARAVATPAEETLAMAGSRLVQVALAVRSWVVPSVLVPVAVNCWASPAGSVTAAGVMARLGRGAGVTDKNVEAVSEPTAARMVEPPKATAVARPVVEMLTMVVASLVQ